MSEKILCITNDFGPRAGGIETFVIGLIERLPKNRIVVYTSKQDGSESYDLDWLSNYGVEVIRDRSKILLPTPRVARNIGKVVNSQGISTAFFGAAAPLALLSPSLARRGVKHIVALTHGHEVWWAKVWPFTIAMKRIGRTTNHLTYLGDFTREAISRSLTLSSQREMVKIAPGIDTQHFVPSENEDQLRRDLGLLDKKIIISVGRLVHRKGQDQLVEAAPTILQEVPNAHIVFVGQGPHLAHLHKRVKELGLEKSVTFIGRITYSDLPRYIRLGDIFAMPSRSRFKGLEVEGLGIVYLEASACGLAVIAGRSGGAPDAVIEGVTGLVVDGTQSQEIARAAIDLLSNPERADAMGRAGRAWIEEKWTWNIWASEFAKLLKVDQRS